MTVKVRLIVCFQLLNSLGPATGVVLRGQAVYVRLPLGISIRALRAHATHRASSYDARPSHMQGTRFAVVAQNLSTGCCRGKDLLREATHGPPVQGAAPCCKELWCTLSKCSCKHLCKLTLSVERTAWCPQGSNNCHCTQESATATAAGMLARTHRCWCKTHGVLLQQRCCGSSSSSCSTAPAGCV